MPARVPGRHTQWRTAVGTAMCLALCAPQIAYCASLTSKDVKIVAKTIGFLDPAPAGGVVAIVYSGSNAASLADANALVSEFGDGVAITGGTVTAKAVEGASLGDGSGYVAVILADGGPAAPAMAAAKARKIPCITSSMALVQAGQCIIAVQSEPKVNITINHAAAVAAGLGFASAFQMLIHEI